MNGPNIGDQHSKLSSSTPQYPGSRAETASWRDIYGNVWTFGGFGYDGKTTRTPRVLNDLWLWNATTKVWTVVRQEHGDKGKVRLMPQARHGAAACGVTGIMFILFGGMELQGNTLYDTWIYNIKSSRWLPLYIHSSRQRVKVTHPPRRSHAATWCTKDSLVVFGGQDGISGHLLNDMWMLSLRKLTWVQTLDTSIFHGAPVDHLFPVPRSGATTWAGSDESLYLFGGNKNPKQLQGHLFHAATHLADTAALLADLWLFSLHNTSWTLIHTGLPLKPDVHNDVGVMEFPGQRQHSTSWDDEDNNLWLFGGEGIRDIFADMPRSQLLSDLWVYNVTLRQWVCCRRGTSYGDTYSHRGQRQTVSPTGRREATVWQYNNIVYITGGFGYDGRHKLAYLNDMWLHLRVNSSIPLYVNRKIESEHRKHHGLSGGIVFAISLFTFGGAVLIMGLYCFVKNIGNLPSFHHNSSRYNVKYSKIFDEANVET